MAGELLEIDKFGRVYIPAHLRTHINRKLVASKVGSQLIILSLPEGLNDVETTLEESAFKNQA
ncbi:MAG: hypothetical protein M1166_05950 [Candidatus Thermoplasmatota archaeon]|nr:hypothetical protein [Candidatus Thermoplasmatota archaeon]